jgi:hypothetical protein
MKWRLGEHPHLRPSERSGKICREDHLIVSIRTLLTRWPWKPIRNCPGRFVLVTTNRSMRLDVLLGRDCDAQTFASHAAKDRVLVVPLEDGGLISYAQPDGRFIHTLNTTEGFGRKLSQLGITLEPNKTP